MMKGVEFKFTIKVYEDFFSPWTPKSGSDGQRPQEILSSLVPVNIEAKTERMPGGA